MPKQVDHERRRREIAAAVARIAMTHGLQGVSFREVAAEAGVSVSLVQHYFGAKDQLLIGTLDIHSARMAGHILDRLGALGPDADPLQRIRAVAGSFIPTDPESRTAMLVYLGFAGAALTDGRLRRAEAFRNADSLLGFFATELKRAAPSGPASVIDPHVQAQAILALVLGLALAVLLEQTTPADALEVLDGHLSLLEPASSGSR